MAGFGSRSYIPSTFLRPLDLESNSVGQRYHEAGSCGLILNNQGLQTFYLLQSRDEMNYGRM